MAAAHTSTTAPRPQPAPTSTPALAAAFAASVRPDPEAGLGLRERKKLRTRRAIRRAAYRLFAAQGFDATHIGQIAEGAEVSPSTVFRYFPTKEDIVLGDEHELLMRNALRARPAGEPPVRALRNAVATAVREEYGADPEVSALRIRLASEVPAIRARLTQSVSVAGRELAAALAERTARPADDLEVQVCTGAMLGGLTQAMLHWAAQRETTGEDLPTVIERALDVLERGLTL